MNEKEIENFEKFRQLTSEQFIKYFEKNFLGKDIFAVMYDELKISILNFAAIAMKFEFLVESIKVIKESKNLGENLSAEDKKLLNNYIVCVEFIAEELNAILKVIEEGIKESYN